jgi:hypothetical protein
LAIAIAVVIGHPDARAQPCTTPDPACHLETGKDLLTADPRRAADELLASYRLDERTDTLALYAVALQLDQRHALALETWKRVIVFRDSELEAAKEAARTATGRKRAAARAAVARAQRQTEQAAEAILKLWPSVARVHIRLAPGQQVAVSRDGAEVDASKDVLVNAGHDELVFTRNDGSVARVAVEVAAGALANIDAPPAPVMATGSPRPVVPSRPRTPEPAVADPARIATRDSASDSPVEAPTIAVRDPARDAPVKPPGDTAKHAPVKAPVDAAKDAATRAPAPVTERSDDEPRSRAMSRVGLGLVAGAVVAEGIAGGLGYLASRDFDRARTGGCSAEGQCPFGPAADLARQSNDRARLAQLTAIGGAALAVTGATLWIVGRGKRHAVTELALHVGPTSTAISGRF